MAGAKPAAFPMDQHHKLAKAGGASLVDAAKYRSLVGRLVYLTITRPELAYSVHVLSQFMHDPKKDHWDAALRVVRFVKGTLSRGLVIARSSSLELKGYTDSDWGRCPLTCRFVIGYFVTFGGTPVSWKTKKQVTVSKSSAEAEYRAMAMLTSELVWLKALLALLGVNYVRPIRVFNL
ncbi:secreted RxLR effector protein 161-like [Silene latifolia]|uniref:secreted RxLR effector protein 161-like n=1 Tax=Silene latifolia TaxID=37657 RepID=UPI003D77A8BD